MISFRLVEAEDLLTMVTARREANSRQRGYNANSIVRNG